MSWTSLPKSISFIFVPNVYKLHFLLFQEKISHLQKILLFPYPLHFSSMLQLVYTGTCFDASRDWIFICSLTALSKSPSQLNADPKTPENEQVRDTAFVFVPVHGINMRQEPVKITLQTNRASWKPWNGWKKWQLNMKTTLSLSPSPMACCSASVPVFRACQSLWLRSGAIQWSKCSKARGLKRVLQAGWNIK